MIPQRTEMTGASQQYTPYAQQQPGATHPMTHMFQHYAPQFGYMPPMPTQMVPVWQTPIVGYRTELVQGADGSFYPENVPVYGHPQLVHMPVPTYYQANNYYADEPTEEISQDSDFDIPSDQVGRALENVTNSVYLDTLTGTSHGVDAFFAPQETVAVEKPALQRQKEPAELLQQFVTKAQSEVITVNRLDYQKMIRDFKDDTTNPKKWEDAMLHDVPQGMLKNLDKLHYFVKPKEEEDKGGRTTFLFPCMVTCKGNMSTKQVAENQDRMCLELTLVQDGEPMHMFLRPLKENDNFRDRVLGDNRENVEQKLYETMYPSVASSLSHKKKTQAPTRTHAVVDDGIHLNFWSPYGVTIKADKK
ncbi:hypothetical protein [Estrella lausannensis]|uniref:Uncharacterized protein n=1 Tax=Estrella lausannensis TaxID=483423 RepID=A0A0H5E2N2_9BACT|nr:hypothetical protein [Estrella lausannensis]CRX37455.1 hypothetical protein ELAC_0092 [Estrella lausannensis]